jgi:deoxyadenosine/deoxycytidine kinase
MHIATRTKQRLKSIEFPPFRNQATGSNLTYITVMGNSLSSGKTSALQALQEMMKGQNSIFLYERWQENTFLKNKRKRLSSELYFLLQDVIDDELIRSNTLSKPHVVIQEVPFEMDYWYAVVDYVLGDLKEEEFRLYWEYYIRVVKHACRPDLIIYLQCNIHTILSRIYSRVKTETTRSFELKQLRRIKALDYVMNRYLHLLQKQNMPLVFIDSGKINFASSNQGKEELYRQVMEGIEKVKTKTYK